MIDASAPASARWPSTALAVWAAPAPDRAGRPVSVHPCLGLRPRPPALRAPP